MLAGLTSSALACQGGAAWAWYTSVQPSDPGALAAGALPSELDLTDVRNAPYLWHKGPDFVKSGVAIALLMRMATLHDTRQLDSNRTRHLWNLPVQQVRSAMFACSWRIDSFLQSHQTPDGLHQTEWSSCIHLVMEHLAPSSPYFGHKQLHLSTNLDTGSR